MGLEIPQLTGGMKPERQKRAVNIPRVLIYPGFFDPPMRAGGGGCCSMLGLNRHHSQNIEVHLIEWTFTFFFKCPVVDLETFDESKSTTGLRMEWISRCSSLAVTSPCWVNSET